MIKAVALASASWRSRRKRRRWHACRAARVRDRLRSTFLSYSGHGLTQGQTRDRRGGSRGGGMGEPERDGGIELWSSSARVGEGEGGTGAEGQRGMKGGIERGRGREGGREGGRGREGQKHQRNKPTVAHSTPRLSCQECGATAKRRTTEKPRSPRTCSCSRSCRACRRRPPPRHSCPGPSRTRPPAAPPAGTAPAAARPPAGTRRSPRRASRRRG